MKATPAKIRFTYTWTFSVVIGSHTVDTAKYTTHSTVTGCTTADSLTSASYHFKVIWYNGGRNTVLWSSREYTSSGTQHCSPKITISAHLPLVYEAITLDCVSPINVCQGNGTYGIDTN